MMLIPKIILDELKSGPVKWIASFFSIILAILVLSQYFGLHNLPPTVDSLKADKDSPLKAGEIITWTAKAIDHENDSIQYKFFLNGDSVTEWSPQNFWIWTNTKASLGENHIEVCIRDGKHADQDSYDGCKISDFSILDANQAPIISSLKPNLSSPREAGVVLVWTTSASDAEGDIVQYKFFLNGKPRTDWSNDPTWIWATSPDDIGTQTIEVKAKDNKHNLDGDDSKTYDFSIVSSPLNRFPVSDIFDTRIAQYLRTNEYEEDSLRPSCIPESKQATCSSPDSCVDCDGKCWPPGRYAKGNTVCSQGKWTIIDSSSGQISSYPRTNEYEEDSLKPSCIPGSKHATCSSPDSCVDCDGKCWPRGSYDSGKIICYYGKWKLT